MATNSLIGIMNKDSSVDYVYCHYCGDIFGVGITLFAFYNTEDKVRELISGGSISSLGCRIVNTTGDLTNRDGSKHTFEHHYAGTTVYYHRDRGEDLRISHAPNIGDACGLHDYNYIFMEDTWYVETNLGYKKLYNVLCDAIEHNKDEMLELQKDKKCLFRHLIRNIDSIEEFDIFTNAIKSINEKILLPNRNEMKKYLEEKHLVETMINDFEKKEKPWNRCE